MPQLTTVGNPARDNRAETFLMRGHKIGYITCPHRKVRTHIHTVNGIPQTHFTVTTLTGEPLPGDGLAFSTTAAGEDHFHHLGHLAPIYRVPTGESK